MNCNLLKVVVHYIAAAKPFKDKKVDPEETVGQLKERVLKAFELSEETKSDGSVRSYTLYFDKNPLESLNQALGELAEPKKILQLKLAEKVFQGNE